MFDITYLDMIFDPELRAMSVFIFGVLILVAMILGEFREQRD